MLTEIIVIGILLFITLISVYLYGKHVKNYQHAPTESTDCDDNCLSNKK